MEMRFFGGESEYMLTKGSNTIRKSWKMGQQDSALPREAQMH